MAGYSLAAATPTELGHPVMRNFPPGRSKLAHPCQAVTQDADGFIYVANGAALRVYDGGTWEFTQIPTECAGIRKFATTADGTIFAGGPSVIGYLRPTGGQKEFVSLAGLLPPSELGCDEISDVLTVGQSVYFADEEKILIWRDGRFTVIPCPTPPHSHGARLHRVGDTVYVTALDRALCQLANGALEVVADDPVLRENQIISIEPGTGGARMLLANGAKIFLRKSLKAWEDTLPATHFMRVHRTQIVNLARITRYERDSDEHT